MKIIKTVCTFLFVITFLSIIVLTNNIMKSNNDYESVKKNKTNVSMVVPISANGSEIKFGYMLDDNFCENNNISLHIRYMESDKYVEKVMVDLSNGVYDDIIIMPADNRNTDLFKYNKFLALNRVIKPELISKLNIDKSFFDRLTYDGELYGLPYDVKAASVFVNNDILESAGLTYPKNMEELKNAASVLSKKNIPLFTLNSNGVGKYFFDYIISNCTDNDVRNITFEKFDKMYNNLKELYELGAFAPGFSEMSDYDSKQLFLKGSAAMIVEDISFCREVNSLNNSSSKFGEKISVEYFPEDVYDSTKKLIYTLGDYTMFFTDKIDSDEKARCVQTIIKKLYDKSDAEAYFSDSFTMSTIKDIKPNSYFNKQMKDFFSLIDSSQMYMRPLDSDYGNALWMDEFMSKIEAALSESKNSLWLWEELNR